MHVDDAVLSAHTICAQLHLPLEEEYHRHESFIPFLHETLIAKGEDAVGHSIRLFCVASASELIRQVIETTMGTLAIEGISSHSERPEDLTLRLRMIVLLVEADPVVRYEWAASSCFHTDLDAIFGLASTPTADDASSLLPHVWWKGREDGKEEAWKESCEVLQNAVRSMEELHHRLLLGMATQGEALSQWLKSLPDKLVRTAAEGDTHRRTVLRNVYFVLLRILEPWMTGSVVEFPLGLLVRQEDMDCPRFGGTLSHLQKESPIRAELITEGQVLRVGTAVPDEPRERPGLIVAPQPCPDLQEAVDPRLASMSISPPALFLIMLNLYRKAVAAEYKQAATQLQQTNQLSNQLEEMERRIEQSPPGESVDHLLAARKVFLDDMSESVRRSAWFKATLFPSETKQDGMFTCCNLLTGLLEGLSTAEDELLSRVFLHTPEFYLEALADTFHALRRGDPPYNMATHAKRQPRLRMLIRFFVRNFDNGAIVSPDTRDLILQTISVLLQYPEYVRQFEKDDFVREKFMHSLIGSFNARFWIPVTSILLRLWQGTGFGHSPAEGADCASVILQSSLRLSATAGGGEGLSSFLNHIFNNLNWTVTEFHVSLKEIEEAAKNRLSADLRDLQRKCNITFELSTHLFRVLELLTLEFPGLFLSESDVNLSRLVEMVLHIVNHVTVGKDSVLFEAIVQLGLPGLDKLNRAAILDPIIGIFSNLGRASISGLLEHSNTLVSKMLSYEHAFLIDNIEYVGNFAACRMTQKDTPLAMMEETTQLFSEFQEATVKQRISERAAKTKEAALSLMSPQEKLARGIVEIVKKEVCTICYTEELDTKFVPCGHTSCRRCVTRHLLNNTNCFFCNAVILNHLDFIAEPQEPSPTASPTGTA